MPPSKDKALFAAIDAGEPTSVRAAVEGGANANGKKGKQSALEYAFARRAKDETLLALIELGAELAPVNDHIVWAIPKEEWVLEKFLAAGADPNIETYSGRPVQVAARAGLLPQVRRLLGAGAQPDLGSMIGNALSDAIQRGHTECALELLGAGATPAAAERYGPLLPMLIELGEKGLVQAFLDAGADPNGRYTLKGPHSKAKKEQQSAGRAGLATALKAIGGAAAGASVPSALQPGESFDDFQKRVDARFEASISEATRVRFSGATPLMVAASEGSQALVELLLERGADVNAADDQGRTALVIAEAAGHGEVAALLRARGGSSAALLPPEQALTLAAERGDAEGIETALGRGAAIDGYDTRKASDGKTALVLAAEGGHPAAVRALVARGADLEQKAKTSPHNTRAILDSASQERTPLHAAAALGHDAIVRLLLDSGASPESRDECRETPLHLAATGNHHATVAILLERGAEVDAKGRDGMTPLLYAAARGHGAVGEQLLAAGANPSQATRAKESALGYAVSSRCVSLVKALVSLGADPDAKNKYGSSPRETASNPEIIAALQTPVVPRPPNGRG
jgi:ankyrin repeat protein